jgi:hypothetical protein
MTDMQLSFLSAEPSAFDVNAVDDGAILDSSSFEGSNAVFLAQRPVDDWVFGLGFTNWKVVIDHALKSCHYELYTSTDGMLGLRKHGYRYSPVPRLPAGAARYIQQQLLALASERKGLTGRHDKMISITPDFAHKVFVENGVCDITIKQNGNIIRTTLQAGHLSFSDTSISDPEPIALQVAQVLEGAGAQPSVELDAGCRSIASHILRIAHGVR